MQAAQVKTEEQDFARPKAIVAGAEVACFYVSAVYRDTALRERPDRLEL